MRATGPERGRVRGLVAAACGFGFALAHFHARIYQLGGFERSPQMGDFFPRPGDFFAGFFDFVEDAGDVGFEFGA